MISREVYSPHSVCRDRSDQSAHGIEVAEVPLGSKPETASVACNGKAAGCFEPFNRKRFSLNFRVFAIPPICNWKSLLAGGDELWALRWRKIKCSLANVESGQ